MAGVEVCEKVFSEPVHGRGVHHELLAAFVDPDQPLAPSNQTAFREPSDGTDDAHDCRHRRREDRKVNQYADPAALFAGFGHTRYAAYRTGLSRLYLALFMVDGVDRHHRKFPGDVLQGDADQAGEDLPASLVKGP